MTFFSTQVETGRARRVRDLVALSVGGVALAYGSQAIATSQNTNKATPVGLEQTLARFPLSFEKNVGQGPAAVRFLAHTPAYSIYLTDAGAALRFNGRAGNDSETLLQWSLVGSDKPTAIGGEIPLKEKSNYLIGKDPRGWHTDVAHVGQVRYSDVYPGVDVVFHGQLQKLEYDFVVAPSANPDGIRMHFEGAQAITLGKNGELQIRTADGTLEQQAPVIYQDIDGVRKPVAGGFRLIRNEGQLPDVAFDVPEYDTHHALVIDPVLLMFSTYLGGSLDDIGERIALDANGNIVIAGNTDNNGTVGFPGSGITGTTFHAADIFVTKLSPDGSEVLFSTYFGTSGSEQLGGMGIDSQGQIVLDGVTDASNFPTVNPFQATSGGGKDCFIVRLNSTGDALLSSTYLGGSGDDACINLAVDGSDDVYVTGHTTSTDFPTHAPLQSSQAGGGDVFAAKFDAPIAATSYATYLGGSGDDVATGIAVDAAGDLYIGGQTESSDFPTANAVQSNFAGGFTDGFIAKLNGAGSALSYSTFLGGSFEDWVADIALAADGKLYVLGNTDSIDFPTVDPIKTIASDDLGDITLSRLDEAGDSLEFSTYFGGSSPDVGMSLAIDASGAIYLTGNTSSTDFPNVEAFQSDYGGANGDAFVTKLNTDGWSVAYSSFLGGDQLDYAYGITVDGDGNAYVTGLTLSSNFPVFEPLQDSTAGDRDAFVSKISAIAEIKDTTPDTIKFGTTYAAPGQLVESFAEPLEGIDPPILVQAASNALIRVNATTWAASAEASPGNLVQLQGTAASEAGAIETFKSSIGDATAKWKIETLAPTQVVDAFSIPAKTGVALGKTAKSTTIAPSGFTAATPISVQNGKYRIGDSGGWVTGFTKAAGTLSPGQTVQVRGVSATTPSTTVSVTLSVGNQKADFDIVTDSE